MMKTTMTPIRRLLVFLIGGGVVTSTGLLFDGLLLRQGVPRIQLLVASNVIAGTIAGFLFVQSRIREREKQHVLEDRLAKVADVNHHVRNALSVVVFYGTQSGNTHAAQLVREAVERIEWTLREVLPRGWNIDAIIAERLLVKSKAAASSNSK
jgi:hypothetical protein